MVNYSKSATALLALVCQLTGTAAYANWDTTEVETDTIVDKKCEEIIADSWSAGSEPLCTRVCDVVTTTMMGDKVIDEYTKVTKGKCLSHGGGGAKHSSGSYTTTYGSKATTSSSTTSSYGSKATTLYGSKATTSYGSKASGSTTYGSKATGESTSYGSKASGSTTYGSKASGSTTYGSKANGSKASGSTTYGSKASGSTTYGSKAVGSTSYGSKADGSKAASSTTYGSKAGGSTTYGSKAGGSTTYGGKGGKPDGSSTGTTYVKPASSGGWGSSSSSSTRGYKPATSGGWGAAPSPPAPTPDVTPAPTTCMEREYYYNDEGICTNEGFVGGGVTSYSSLPECCEATQSLDDCEFVDICCDMRLWYLSEFGECTNEGGVGGTSYSSLLECCEATQTADECEFVDVCYPDPPTPEPTPDPTPEPTPEPTPSPTPSPVEVVTPEPTPSPTTCLERDYYYNDDGVCTNEGFVPGGVTSFSSLLECCEATQIVEECEFVDICSPNPPKPESTPEPTPEPTPSPTPSPVEVVTSEPTPSPTTCMEQEYYNAGGICTNEGMTPPGGTAFPTLLECCEETQTANECEFVDICCEMRLWYLSESGVCTNGFTQDGEFASLQECCEETQPGADCLYDDICNPDPPAPTPNEVVSMVPTLVFTPEPTPGEGTGEPTFGSTPTVSKEVTGPPTKGRN
jgi:hypothetical protein